MYISVSQVIVFLLWGVKIKLNILQGNYCILCIDLMSSQQKITNKISENWNNKVFNKKKSPKLILNWKKTLSVDIKKWLLGAQFWHIFRTWHSQNTTIFLDFVDLAFRTLPKSKLNDLTDNYVHKYWYHYKCSHVKKIKLSYTYVQDDTNPSDEIPELYLK